MTGVCVCACVYKAVSSVEQVVLQNGKSSQKDFLSILSTLDEWFDK